MPELPPTTRARLSSQGLSDRDVDVIMSVDAGDQVPFDGELKTNGAVVFFDKVAQGRDPKMVANWYETLSLPQRRSQNCYPG
jgi:aspartyl-tRNA(Asn)/glutamyl-tRNA(Gln) amidotransferase subunit B